MAGTWSATHSQTVKFRLESYVLPKIGERPISQIERPEYAKVIQSIEESGIAETAKRVAVILGQLARYALTIGAVKYDCTAGLASIVKRQLAKHVAAIADPDELGQLLVDIDNYNRETGTYHLLKLAP